MHKCLLNSCAFSTLCIAHIVYVQYTVLAAALRAAADVSSILPGGFPRLLALVRAAIGSGDFIRRGWAGLLPGS